MQPQARNDLREHILAWALAEQKLIYLRTRFNAVFNFFVWSLKIIWVLIRIYALNLITIAKINSLKKTCFMLYLNINHVVAVIKKIRREKMLTPVNSETWRLNQKLYAISSKHLNLRAEWEKPWDHIAPTCQQLLISKYRTLNMFLIIFRKHLNIFALNDWFIP